MWGRATTGWIIGTAALGVAWHASAATGVAPSAPPIFSTYSWTGLYAGFTVGADWQHNSTDLSYPNSDATGTSFTGNAPVPVNLPYSNYFTESGVPATAWPTRLSARSVTAAGGITLGYNYQVNSLVLGLEADYTFLSRGTPRSWKNYATGTGSVDDGYGTVTGSRASSITSDASLAGLGTIRGRVGFAQDRFLAFATGGLAIGLVRENTYANLQENYAYSDSYESASDAYSSQSSFASHANKAALGYVVGGGVEYALTDQVSLKFEGLYYKLNALREAASGAGSYSENGGAPTSFAVESIPLKIRNDGVLGPVLN
jgi:outer membrane immunogenic protein